ncbi:MAG: exodeoxyribonuclease III [Candidatus Marinimicrobia bacterium CG08_land_8_20_14_0_20_45_22]|nr:MAG: exodeoxyribonuclease III [Candidatus Marinimicrobia bacterium CG08_land_8_20_14_0_20_45_22]
MKIVSWNVNGIRSVLKKGLLDWLRSEDPDIFCVQETKASEEVLPPELISIGGYHSYFSSAERKGYSGVALYSKVEPLSITRGFGNVKFDTEGRIIVAEYEKFTLFDIYFPNGQASEERLRFKFEFFDEFLSVVEKMVANKRNVVICGDFNIAHKEIDIAHPKENETISGFLPEERAWLDRFVERGYVDTFRRFDSSPQKYTWWSPIFRARDRNVGWRIDYFFVNAAFINQVKSAFILPDVMGSDHCPVGITSEFI